MIADTNMAGYYMECAAVLFLVASPACAYLSCWRGQRWNHRANAHAALAILLLGVMAAPEAEPVAEPAIATSAPTAATWRSDRAAASVPDLDSLGYRAAALIPGPLETSE